MLFCREVWDFLKVLLFPVFFQKKEGDFNGEVYGQKIIGKGAGG